MGEVINLDEYKKKYQSKLAEVAVHNEEQQKLELKNKLKDDIDDAIDLLEKKFTITDDYLVFLGNLKRELTNVIQYFDSQGVD